MSQQQNIDPKYSQQPKMESKRLAKVSYKIIPQLKPQPSTRLNSILRNNIKDYPSVRPKGNNHNIYNFNLRTIEMSSPHLKVNQSLVLKNDYSLRKHKVLSLLTKPVEDKSSHRAELAEKDQLISILMKENDKLTKEVTTFRIIQKVVLPDNLPHMKSMKKMNSHEKSLESCSFSYKSSPRKLYFKQQDLHKLMESILRCPSVRELFMMLFKMLPEVISYDSLCFYLLSPELVKCSNKFMGMNYIIQHLSWENEKFVLLVANSEQTVDPKFESIEQLKSGRKMPHLLFRGVVDPFSKELLFGIQLERKKIRNLSNDEYLGFKDSDEQILALLCSFLSSRINYFIKIAKIKKENSVIRRIPGVLADFLLSQTPLELFKKIHKLLPPLLRVEVATATVVFRDCFCLYGLNPLNYEEEIVLSIPLSSCKKSVTYQCYSYQKIMYTEKGSGEA